MLIETESRRGAGQKAKTFEDSVIHQRKSYRRADLSPLLGCVLDFPSPLRQRETGSKYNAIEERFYITTIFWARRAPLLVSQTISGCGVRGNFKTSEHAGELVQLGC